MDVVTGVITYQTKLQLKKSRKVLKWTPKKLMMKFSIPRFYQGKLRKTSQKQASNSTTEDMSINKLLQISVSNIELLL